MQIKSVNILLLTLYACSLLLGFGSTGRSFRPSLSDQLLRMPEEKHLKNIKQLTFGGENAEAYFSGDGKQLIFQSTRDGRACDQIYTMDLDGGNVRLISTGSGRTTCSYFFPNDRRLGTA
jgi:TolB protein